jgi:predicted GNAT family acetyltransferase
MVRIERYKLFHNSQDFENILKKSANEFFEFNVDFNFVVKNYLSVAKNNSTIFLARIDNNIIGYLMMAIVKKEVKFSFTYILPEFRGNGYSDVLREHGFQAVKDDFENMVSYINIKNLPSKMGLDKYLKKYNCEYKTEIVHKGNKTYEKYTIKNFRGRPR